MKTTLVCPTCGAQMILKKTKKFRYKDGRQRNFYSCSMWPMCDTSISANPDETPVGVASDKETRSLRNRCHDLLTKKFGPNTRDQYKFIRKVMKMTPDEAHIGKFSKEQCIQLIEYIEEALSVHGYPDLD